MPMETRARAGRFAPASYISQFRAPEIGLGPFPVYWRQRLVMQNSCVIGAGSSKEATVALVDVKQLLEAGVHFGHRASRWNPKMRPYIYGKRNLIHIIDLRETVRGLLRAYRYLAKVASRGSLVLFVGTKRQAKEAVEREAEPLRHALRQRTLAGRHAHQLPHHPRSPQAAPRTRSDVAARRRERRPRSICPAYMKTMLNEAGKLDLNKAPDTADIRTLLQEDGRDAQPRTDQDSAAT